VVTQNRFFSLHFYYLFSWFNFNYLILLHKDGSNSPIGSDTGVDDVPFTLLFLKDVFALFCFLVVFGIFVFYFPNTLNHPDNYIQRIHYKHLLTYLSGTFTVLRHSKINAQSWNYNGWCNSCFINSTFY
jgi:quinol-cytochrome oxidoreductase complex cytochrome b subunit